MCYVIHTYYVIGNNDLFFLIFMISPKERMDLDNAGLFSFLTFSWVTQYMKMAYTYGLKAEDVPLCSVNDSCDYSAQRIEYMWNEEVKSKGIENASLTSVVWQFAKTRILLHMILYTITLTFGFIGPVNTLFVESQCINVQFHWSQIVFMRKLLEFCEDDNPIWWQGVIWAIGFALVELLRVIFFAAAWGTSYRYFLKIKLNWNLFGKLMNFDL